jgi:hypothetical protein
MTHMSGILRKKDRRTAAPRLIVWALGGLLVSACSVDNLLEVEDFEVATPESLENPSALPTLVAGAIGDFQVAYSGNGLNDAFNAAVGLFTDEFRSSDTFTTRNDTDRRFLADPANGNLSDIAYVALHRARRSAEAAAVALDRVAAATDSRASEMLSISGFAYVALGEGFCSNQPAGGSGLEDIRGPITTQQVFDTAIARFDAAIAAVGADAATDRRRRLALVGKARALVNNNQIAQAAALVTETAVPTTFIHFNEHSDNSGRQENSVWNLNGSNRRYTVSEVEGGTGLNFRSANDPRIPWRDRNANGFDNTVRLFEQLRYPDRSADVVVADGIEARLVEAEAALRANDVTTFLAKLNKLRDSTGQLMAARYTNWVGNVTLAFGSVPTLAPLTDPGTQTAREDMLFRERAFWLYGTGHRLGDMRRLIRQYGRAANTVFPTGAWHKGGNYGTDVAFSLPFREQNNPDFVAADCSTTTP